MVRNEINISTWNVCGKGSPQEIDKLLSKSVEPQSSHVVCIQQANLPSSGEDLPNFSWLCSGQYGSAVLVNKNNASLKVGTFEQVCEQICVAEVANDDGLIMNIISCYIPPSTEYITKDLWEKLATVIKNIPGSKIYVLAGDFNAEIGKDDVCGSELYAGIIGPKLYHKASNENGIQLKKMVLSLHAMIVSSFGDVTTKPLHTCKDGELSLRSHIVVPWDRVPYPSRIIFQDCKTSWYPDYKSALLTKHIKLNVFKKVSSPNESRVTIGSWNIQGATPASVDKALSEVNSPVVCVQDLFLTSDEDLETPDYNWFTSKKLWGKNVGILIKKGLDILISDFAVVSESLCVGSVTWNGVMINIICCSLPSHTDSEKFQEVTKLLVELVKNIPEGTMYVVAGDFNTNVTYAILDDVLVFDKGDENAAFVKKMMKDWDMEMPYAPKNSVTHASEKGQRNTSLILISSSCLWKYFYRRFVRWVPYFENGIVSLYLIEGFFEYDRFLSKSKGTEAIKEKKESDKKKKVCADGFIFVTRRLVRLKKSLSISNLEQDAYRFIHEIPTTAERKSDLPADVVAKYKNSPPPLDELLRILGDEFVLYHGYMLESCVPKGHFCVLTASFEYLNRGPLIAECIDVLEEATKQIVKKVIKFHWNGIVVHQEEGGKFTNYKRIINKGQTAFISILGQHCFTVKAKASFYNEGLQPMCEDKDKLNKVLRVVKKSEFSKFVRMEQIRQYITKYLAAKPYRELVFGPDFSYSNFLLPIKNFAASKGYGLRVFKSAKDLENFNHVSVFVDFTPHEIHKILMKIPEHQDLRYQLIPPCGTDRDYFEWIGQWTEKTIPEEYFKLYEKVKTSDPDVTHTNGDTEEISTGNMRDFINIQTKNKKRDIGFVNRRVRQARNGEEHKVFKCSNINTTNTTLWLPKGRRDWVNNARQQSDLPLAEVNKHKETPPSAEQLTRIIGDEFVLYYGFDRESCAVSRPQSILAESFEGTGRGGVMMESIEVNRRGTPLKRIVKFKWNGICIHIEEGHIKESLKNIMTKGQAALIDKLGKHYYAVKAKMSYLNKGFYPVCAESEKLNEVFRILKTSDLPSMELAEVKKFVLDFFGNNNDVELVFGPEFSTTEILEPLKKYASEKDLGYRLLKSAEGVTSWDSVAIFNKRSPLEIRERLLKIPDHQDFKFYLVPPCEFFDKSHFEWIKSWTAEKSDEEFKFILEEEEKMKSQSKPKPSPEAQKSEPPKKTPAVGSKRGSQGTENQRTNAKRMKNQPSNIQRKNIQRENLRRQQTRSGTVEQNRRQQPDYHRDNSQYSQSGRPDVWISDSPGGLLSQQLQQPQQYAYGYEAPAQAPLYRSEDYYADSAPVQSLRAEDYYGGTSYSLSQPFKAEDYDSSYWSQVAEQQNRIIAEQASRKRDWEQIDFSEGVSYNQQPTSDNYPNSQISRRQENSVQPERYVPERKRPRNERPRNESSAKVMRPRWDDIAPLVIVWPVNVRSEPEKDHRKILEANFPTEVLLEQNSQVAVFVTLPLRNRRDKKYCLCVGDGVHNATKTALDMIVKRSSIIKHTVTFLPPDGEVPNFIRYKIPCQTNPRTYIILSWMETGPLTNEKVHELLTSFKDSLNEDLFFDKDHYTHDMKLLLLDRAPKCGLNVRHFGAGHKLVDRYVCVYKTKPKDEVLEEVLKMRDLHPKYRLVANKLPPRLGLNIF